VRADATMMGQGDASLRMEPRGSAIMTKRTAMSPRRAARAERGRRARTLPGMALRTWPHGQVDDCAGQQSSASGSSRSLHTLTRAGFGPGSAMGRGGAVDVGGRIAARGPEPGDVDEFGGSAPPSRPRTMRPP